MPSGEMRAAIAELESRLRKAIYTSEVRGRRISELYREIEALSNGNPAYPALNGEKPYKSIGLANEARVTVLSYTAGARAFLRELFR